MTTHHDHDHHHDHDVIVIGGGPAGSLTAALLAIEGRSVLLLESESFPRYHIGESLVTGMIPVLERAGVDLAEIDRRFRPKTGITLVWGEEKELWRTPFKLASSFDHSWHVDRAEFDQLLLDNARTRGVTVLERAKVTDALIDGGAVRGVRFHHDGVEHEARARMTVDASGQAKVLARRLTTTDYRDDLKSVAIWGYHDYEPHSEESEFDIVVESLEGRRWTWMIPITDDKASLGVIMPVAEYSRLRAGGANQQEIYLDAVSATRITGPMVRDLGTSTSEQSLRTTRDWSHTSRDWYGDGWVVVGDSAAFVDPLFSFGVFLASSGAWLASRAIHSYLDEGLDRAFDNYRAVYSRLVEDMLNYVRFFYDSDRRREDYEQRAAALARVYSESSQVGFITLLAGVSRLPEVIDFDPMGSDGLEEAKKLAQQSVDRERTAQLGAMSTP